MSNSPAAWRTAKCSSMMPVYSMGISQPPNSAILAPSCLCRGWSGVLFKGTVDVIDVETNSARDRSQANTGPRGCQEWASSVRMGVKRDGADLWHAVLADRGLRDAGGLTPQSFQ